MSSVLRFGILNAWKRAEWYVPGVSTSEQIDISVQARNYQNFDTYTEEHIFQVVNGKERMAHCQSYCIPYAPRSLEGHRPQISQMGADLEKRRRQLLTTVSFRYKGQSGSSIQT